MSIFEAIDFKDLEGHEGLEGKRGRKDKPKTKRLSPDKVSVKDDIRGLSSDNPLDILINKEENPLENDLKPIMNERQSGEIESEIEPDYSEVLKRLDGEEKSETTKEVEGFITASQKAAVSKRAAPKMDANTYFSRYDNKAPEKKEKIKTKKETHIPKRNKFKVIDYSS